MYKKHCFTRVCPIYSFFYCYLIRSIHKMLLISEIYVCIFFTNVITIFTHTYNFQIETYRYTDNSKGNQKWKPKKKNVLKKHSCIFNQNEEKKDSSLKCSTIAKSPFNQRINNTHKQTPYSICQKSI